MFQWVATSHKNLEKFNRKAVSNTTIVKSITQPILNQQSQAMRINIEFSINYYIGPTNMARVCCLST